MFTGGADRSLSVIDLATGKIQFQKQTAHNHPLHCIMSYENLLATGDAEGVVKVWDLRQTKQIFAWEENEDYVSRLLLVPERNALLAPSGDSTLSVFNIKQGKLIARSEYTEDDLLSIALIKEGQKVVCGSQDGVLFLWDWGEWEYPMDHFPGHPQSVDALVPIDKDTLATASTDGLIRVVGIHPNKMLGVIGEHGEMPVECLELSHDRKYMASSSHDLLIKFWNVAYLFEPDTEADTEADADNEAKGQEGKVKRERDSDHETTTQQSEMRTGATKQLESTNTETEIDDTLPSSKKRRSGGQKDQTGPTESPSTSTAPTARTRRKKGKKGKKFFSGLA